MKNKAVFIVSAAMLLLPLLFLSQTYGLVLLVFIGIYVIAGSGLDLLFGYSGQISLGQAGFYAIGAYGSTLLSMHLGIPVILSMILGAAMAAVIGAVIAYPSAKLVHHFLALSTIAFGELMHLLIIHSPGDITKGFSGIASIPPLELFGISFNTNLSYYYFVLVCVFIFLFIKQRIVHSKIGRSFIAIRDDSAAAASSGINVHNYKILAFVLSAFFTGFAGALYAHAVRFISPETFTISLSIALLTIVLFGGMGTFLGPIIGSVIVILIKEALQFTGNFQSLIYGIFLLLVLLFMPKGVAPFLINAKTWLKRRVIKNVGN